MAKIFLLVVLLVFTCLLAESVGGGMKWQIMHKFSAGFFSNKG